MMVSSSLAVDWIARTLLYPSFPRTRESSVLMWSSIQATALGPRPGPTPNRGRLFAGTTRVCRVCEQHLRRCARCPCCHPDAGRPDRRSRTWVPACTAMTNKTCRARCKNKKRSEPISRILCRRATSFRTLRIQTVIPLGRASRHGSSRLPARSPSRVGACLFDVAPRRDCPFHPGRAWRLVQGRALRPATRTDARFLSSDRDFEDGCFRNHLPSMFRSRL